MGFWDKKKLLILFLGAAVLTAGFFLIQNKSAPNVLKLNPLKEIINKGPSPTPFPFSEITIPYLRAREYTSNLGELNQINENANYSSYLTSYDSDGLKINGLLTRPKGAMPVGGVAGGSFCSRIHSAATIPNRYPIFGLRRLPGQKWSGCFQDRLKGTR